MKKHISILLVMALWLGLTAFAWVKPASATSDSERRPLAQFPELSAQEIFSGSFMTEFADYAVDQFPLRDAWRTINACLTYYGLGRQDNNGIYIHDGYAAKMEYPMDEKSLEYAAARLSDLYDLYLADSGSRVFFAPVPDKSYYLAQEAGVLALDYEALFAYFDQQLPWAQQVDLTQCLTIDSYYRTDTHWRQEALLPVLEQLGQALEIPVTEGFTQVSAKPDFYGVYYGQAAVPMDPDELNYLTWDGFSEVSVYSVDTGKTTALFDQTKLDSKDPYEAFLSGNMAIQVVENPNAATDRELIVFRDSFGSSLVPLLAPSYVKITLVDTRYIAPMMVGQFVEFTGQDVLMVYSTLVLNSSGSLRK